MEPPPNAGDRPDSPVVGAPGLEPEPEVFLSRKDVECSGVTLPSFVEWRARYQPQFANCLDNTIIRLGEGYEFVALFSLFSQAINNAKTSVKKNDTPVYLSSLGDMIRALQGSYSEWKRKIDILQGDSSRLKGIFYNIVSKWQIPTIDRKALSPTAICIRTFYRYVEEVKGQQTHDQKRTEEMLKSLMQIRQQIEALNIEVRAIFETSTPLYFNIDYLDPVHLRPPMSAVRQALAPTITAYRTELLNAEIAFDAMKQDLQNWTSWCARAEILCAKESIRFNQIETLDPHIQLFQRHQGFHDEHQKTDEREKSFADIKTSLETQLKWASARLTHYQKLRANAKQLVDVQLGVSKTEDTVFEEGAAKQINLRSRDLLLRITQILVGINTWMQKAAPLHKKLNALVAQARAEEQARLEKIEREQKAHAELGPIVVPEKSRWPIVSLLSSILSRSESVPKVFPKVQFSDPPKIPEVLSFRDFVDNHLKFDAVSGYCTQRWTTLLTPPEEMIQEHEQSVRRAGEPETIDTRWIRFNKDEKNGLIGLINRFLLQVVYPCHAFQAEISLFKTLLSSTNLLQTTLLRVHLKKCKIDFMGVSRCLIEMKDNIIEFQSKLERLYQNMEVSPNNLSNAESEHIRVTLQERIKKVQEAQAALKEIQKFLKEKLTEAQTIVTNINAWLDSQKLFDGGIPVWAEENFQTIRSQISFSAFVREHKGGDVQPPSVKAQNYQSIIKFTEAPKDQLEQYFLKFTEQLNPYKSKQFMGMMQARQSSNFNTVWDCFLAQAREVLDTTVLMKAYLGDLLVLEWDAKRLHDMDYNEKAGPGKRENDWKALKARWDILIAHHQAWISLYHDTMEWLNAIIAKHDAKCKQREWYLAQTDVAFRSVKDVEKYLEHFEHALAYWDLAKKQLEHLYTKQIVSASTEITTWLNSMKRLQEGNWFNPNEPIANPFLNPAKIKAEQQPPVAAEAAQQ